MLRVFLFLATNIAVVLFLSLVLRLLGVDRFTGYNYDHLFVFSLVFGFAGSFISLFMSKWLAKRSSGARVIEVPQNSQEQWLLDTVMNLAMQSNIKMPEVAIFPSDAANAFATGWNKNNALVAVSTGMLSRYTPNEISAVMAHEVGHVANGDMLTMSLLQGILNTFVIFFARVIGFAVDNAMRNNDSDAPAGHGFGYMLTVMVLEIVLGIVASTIIAWFSRRREFKADEAGADLAGKDNMIAALRRIAAEQRIPVDMPESIMAFGINGAGIKQMFASHPPLDMRIKALEAYQGGEYFKLVRG